MNDSILETVKKLLGIPEDYTVFDPDIIMHINTVFSDLHQLGVGPQTGFAIEDKAAEWSSFTNSVPMLNSVKTYVVLRVRLLFDPPATSFAIAAMEKQVQQFEWRLNVQQEGVRHPWQDPQETSLLG